MFVDFVLGWVFAILLVIFVTVGTLWWLLFGEEEKDDDG